MRTVYSPAHQRHHGHSERIDGHLLPCFEVPRGAEPLRARVCAAAPA